MALDPMWAAAAAVGVVIVVLLLWKLLKFAFRIALVVAAGALIIYLLRAAEVL